MDYFIVLVNDLHPYRKGARGPAQLQDGEEKTTDLCWVLALDEICLQEVTETIVSRTFTDPVCTCKPLQAPPTTAIMYVCYTIAGACSVLAQDRLKKSFPYIGCSLLYAFRMPAYYWVQTLEVLPQWQLPLLSLTPYTFFSKYLQPSG